MRGARLPRPQRVTTRHGALELVVAGEGAPVLVLLNGAGVMLDGWARLFPGIARLGRVVACNRFGLGASSAPRRPLSAALAVESLREALAVLRLPPPYLLVGHSLGGLHAQLYARRHPQEVGAVVLLEATHAADRGHLQGQEGRLAAVLGKLLAVPQRLLWPNLQAELAALEASTRELEAAGPFPPVPLAVVSGGREPPRWLVPPERLRARRAHQRELARLSPQAVQVVAERSGHFPQLTQPALVLEVVASLAGRLRAGEGPALPGAGSAAGFSS